VRAAPTRLAPFACGGRFARPQRLTIDVEESTEAASIIGRDAELESIGRLV